MLSIKCVQFATNKSMGDLFKYQTHQEYNPFGKKSGCDFIVHDLNNLCGKFYNYDTF